MVARITNGLTLQAAAPGNQSRQTNSPVLIDNNARSHHFGRPITQSCDTEG